MDASSHLERRLEIRLIGFHWVMAAPDDDPKRNVPTIKKSLKASEVIAEALRRQASVLNLPEGDVEIVARKVTALLHQSINPCLVLLD